MEPFVSISTPSSTSTTFAEGATGIAVAATQEEPLMQASPGFRLESDSLGTVEVPEDAYWGVHTKRALDNFPIAKRPISVYPDLVRALAQVKQACARANVEVGALTPEKGRWIDAACTRIIQGARHEEFVEAAPVREPQV